jgi:hypothetical protein
MRLPTFRALLIALALVFQTVAGGIGVAGTSSVTGQQTISGHCEHADFSDKSAPPGKAGHRHDCLSCQLCAGAPSTSASISIETRLVFREVRRVGFARAFIHAPPSRNARAQQARAPPTSRV